MACETMACGLNSAHCLFLQIKFYWSTALPVCVCIFCYCFHSIMVIVKQLKQRLPIKPKILLFCPLEKKSADPWFLQKSVLKTFLFSLGFNPCMHSSGVSQGVHKQLQGITFLSFLSPVFPLLFDSLRTPLFHLFGHNLGLSLSCFPVYFLQLCLPWAWQQMWEGKITELLWWKRRVSFLQSFGLLLSLLLLLPTRLLGVWRVREQGKLKIKDMGKFLLFFWALRDICPDGILSAHTDAPVQVLDCVEFKLRDSGWEKLLNSLSVWRYFTFRSPQSACYHLLCWIWFANRYFVEDFCICVNKIFWSLLFFLHLFLVLILGCCWPQYELESIPPSSGFWKKF